MLIIIISKNLYFCETWFKNKYQIYYHEQNEIPLYYYVSIHGILSVFLIFVLLQKVPKWCCKSDILLLNNELNSKCYEKVSIRFLRKQLKTRSTPQKSKNGIPMA